MLDSLFAGALEDAERRRESLPTDKLEQLASESRSPLEALSFFSGPNVSVIAEIKRASPSKGHLATISDPGALANIYESAGASAISVLTEQRGFGGSLEDLVRVRSACSLPVLRKDFISNEYQILEARAFGADMILLIVAGLNDQQLRKLKSFANELGLTVLVETHNREEVQRAADLGSELVGINARDLSTFETDRELFAQLVNELPASVIKVAESAVRGPEDVAQYALAGADCVLVGEALVTGDAESLIKSFVEIPKA